MADTEVLVAPQLVDARRFIGVIETKPSIWDSRLSDYSNRMMKQEDWKQVCREMICNFDSLSKEKQAKIGTDFQKKWKGIRSSFSRELQKRKRAESDPALTAKRTYVYYDYLTFLLPVSVHKNVTTDLEENTEDSNQEVPISEAVISKSNNDQRKQQATKRPYYATDDSTEQLHSILSESLHRRTSTTSETSDDDKTFLLSLHSDLKNIPLRVKLDAKMEIMAVLKKYSNHYSIT